MEPVHSDMAANYLVTGAAGFIGSFLSRKLLELGCSVIGIDNLNTYYDVDLKTARLKLLREYPAFTFIKQDITDKSGILDLFCANDFQYVIHLAAQAGVRYSLENPESYIQSNINGFFNILEACRTYPVKHLLYASSSSVYGANDKVPFEEKDITDSPLSLYAATKKANELMAYTYSHLYHIPVTGMRFFTVYGPMGRPDMAYYRFTQQFFNGEAISIFNNGDSGHDLYRDFTYIDDIVEGIIKLIDCPPSGEVTSKVYNLGNNKPEKLMFFVEALEKALSASLGREIVFKKIYEPMKSGDVPATYACVRLLNEAVGFTPDTSIQEGLSRFTDWYVEYYGVK